MQYCTRYQISRRISFRSPLTFLALLVPFFFSFFHFFFPPRSIETLSTYHMYIHVCNNVAQGMIAVAAEAVSRLLFFELAHDPELLARLVVLYFEKGSAADPAANANALGGGGGGGREGSVEEEDQEGEADEEMHKDAKAIGSSVRLSQVHTPYVTYSKIAKMA